MTREPLLDVTDLAVHIRGRSGGVRAVDGLSFHIAAGETLALVGESGSGKTMSAMSLLGLLPSGLPVTMAGSARFDARDLLRLSERDLRAVRGRRIGVMFQDQAQALNPSMTVGAQIREAISASGGPVSRLASLIEEVELAAVPDIAMRYPHQLSGGQQQRVMLAMAVAGDPILLVADEPTTALDATVEARILALLKRMRDSRKMAMLLISHDFSVVRRLADRVLILRRGRMIEEGHAEDVLARPRDPYTRALLACRPDIRRKIARLPTLDMPVPVTPLAAPTQDASEIVAVSELSVSYHGKGLFAPPVVGARNVSLRIARGGAVGLLGESGSGKSSVARAVVGLVPSAAGEIRLAGVPVGDATRMSKPLRRRVQYVFQDPYGALNPRMTVERLLGEPMRVHGMGSDRKMLTRLLEEVGLGEEHLARYPRELSGGQRQRLTIARALALEPDLLICDEVVSALDVSVQAQVLNLLKDMQAARGLALLFISHDIAVIRHMCDFILVLRNGEVIESGATDAVIQDPKHEYTREMIAAAHAGLPPDKNERGPLLE